jgi:hypothetical protein
MLTAYATRESRSLQTLVTVRELAFRHCYNVHNPHKHISTLHSRPL